MKLYGLLVAWTGTSVLSLDDRSDQTNNGGETE